MPTAASICRTTAVIAVLNGVACVQTACTIMICPNDSIMYGSGNDRRTFMLMEPDHCPLEQGPRSVRAAISDGFGSNLDYSMLV